jgi:hypothetical protein
MEKHKNTAATHAAALIEVRTRRKEAALKAEDQLEEPRQEEEQEDKDMTDITNKRTHNTPKTQKAPPAGGLFLDLLTCIIAIIQVRSDSPCFRRFTIAMAV